MAVTTPRDTGTDTRIDELSMKVDDLALVDSKLAESSAQTDRRLVELKVEMSAGFKRLDERFEKFDEKLDEKFEKLDGKFEKLDGKLERLDEKFDGKFEMLDEKFDRKFDRLTGHLVAGAILMIAALLGVIATLVATLIHVF